MLSLGVAAKIVNYYLNFARTHPPVKFETRLPQLACRKLDDFIKNLTPFSVANISSLFFALVLL
ncbi:hypothetical protein D1BOALGB6SA_8508 [Olavius sp. associated proteobacterium Delta 1]|nr:hypothetical protein D1BOALGB6SA_8508 [Olavius sp. associated proteobacterium Delta 1]